MPYTQLVKFNLSQKGRSGWCLEYVRKGFGAPAVEPSAWQAWQKAKYKHTGSRTMPKVQVPVFFSYIENGINYGHVVAWIPGKGFYSSPYNNLTTKAVLKTLGEVERIYGCKYVGWAEDVSKVRVVKPVGAKPTPKKVYHFVKKGEYLALIAERHRTTWKKLVRLNALKYPSLVVNPNYLKVGWKLRVK